MKKAIIFVFFISFISSAQIHEIGGNINIGKTFGELDTDAGEGYGPGVGFFYKRNLNPRIAKRFAFNYVGTELTRYAEVSAGIDFNLHEYNPFRFISPKISPYIILEATGFYYEPKNGSGTVSFAIPFGLGIKKTFNQNWGWSLESKFRISFTDKLDNNESNASTNDAYFYTGFGIFYTFGRRNDEERTRF